MERRDVSTSSSNSSRVSLSALRLEAITSIGWKPSLVGWKPSLQGYVAIASCFEHRQNLPGLDLTGVAFRKLETRSSLRLPSQGAILGGVSLFNMPGIPKNLFRSLRPESPSLPSSFHRVVSPHITCSLVPPSVARGPATHTFSTDWIGPERQPIDT